LDVAFFTKYRAGCFRPTISFVLENAMLRMRVDAENSLDKKKLVQILYQQEGTGFP